MIGQYEPELVKAAYAVFGKSYAYRREYVKFKSEKMSGNIDLQEELTLDFTENSFGFSFAVLGSSYPASDKILCKLDGYDNQWRDVSVGKAIHWTDVPAGTYRLLLSNGKFYFIARLNIILHLALPQTIQYLFCNY